MKQRAVMPSSALECRPMSRSYRPKASSSIPERTGGHPERSWAPGRPYARERHGLVCARLRLHLMAASTPRHYISTPSVNATLVKAEPGVITMIAASNINAAPRYVKFFDGPARPNVGTDTPVLTLIVPGAVAGGGFILPITGGINFEFGIGFAITTGVGDMDVGATAQGEVVLNLAFQ